MLPLNLYSVIHRNGDRGGATHRLRDTGLVHTGSSGLQEMPDFIGFL
jgi:hypothetical protein